MNAQLMLDEYISSLIEAPRLLLHSCCAPCSSYVIEYLSDFFRITVFYYNPNIYPNAEYRRRADEQKRLLSLIKTRYPVSYLEEEDDEQVFTEYVSGLEDCVEGGARCAKCFELRLLKTAKTAKELGFDCFATTLTVSPHKNADAVNAAGELASEQYSLRYIPSDFKKRNGYLRSLQLSKEYGLYRQDYCGCRFSANKP